MKEYWLGYTSVDNDNLDVYAGPFENWMQMRNSPDYEDLDSGVREDLYSGFFYLITEPGQCPIMGGFIDGMQDPSL